LLLTACSQPQANNAPDNHQVDEHRDQWRPREAQSDFLDIGKQAGIEWLSFVPDDQHDYPEYFEGLDRDQSRRLRLAPKGSDEQVLLQFSWTDQDELFFGGLKLWPVDWYGTELMAIELSETSDVEWSVALAKASASTLNARMEALGKTRGGTANYLGVVVEDSSGNESTSQLHLAKQGDYSYCYMSRRLKGRTFEWDVVLEGRRKSGAAPFKPKDAAKSILDGISIKRELALEGSPKHKCTSSLAEQLRGTLRFPDGTLKLSISEGLLVRKIGGDSTIQIDGKGAEPWILIRRLKPSEAEGDLRARLRSDTTFNRRLKVDSGKFSEGYVPEGATLPIVCFDYDDSSSENNLLGILKAGDELLTFEVVSNGVKDGEFRRALKQEAIKLFAGATAEPATEAPEFEPLVGWNVGTMGQDK